MDAKRRRFARRARLKAVDAGADPAAALRAELVLLQEENARLKAAQYQRPDLGTLLERARALPGTAAGGEEAGDEAAQMLVEGLVLRESLLKVCVELSDSMQAVESRLRDLPGGDALGGARTLERGDDHG